MSKHIHIAIAILLFFFNSSGLPMGITWTALLAPLFGWWVIIKGRRDFLLPFIFCLLPFSIVHFFRNEINTQEYMLTLANLFAVYIFAHAFHLWIKTSPQVYTVFKTLLLFNGICCIAAIFFYFTPASHIFWIKQNLTEGVVDFLRLKMFTYEASYYAMLFTPIFFYFLLRYIVDNTKENPWILLPALFLPYILSFSVGVIVCLLVAGMLVLFFHFGELHKKRRIVNGFINTVFFLAVVLVFLFIFFRDNAFFTRVENILSGHDTSAGGRTADAFILAQRLLQEGSFLWGIGPGQLEVVGADVIREYYLYHHSTPVAIPNAAAETLVIFGWVGFVFRIAIEIFFFLVTRTWTNYYRLGIFCFIFIYQFTGSYITNPIEYVLWVIAFTPAFSEFAVKKNTVPEVL